MEPNEAVTLGPDQAAVATGRFENGHGTFHGQDAIAGQSILVRFDWTVFDTDTATWEQAFSWDDGVTWVHNWRMSFTRVTD